MRKADYVRRESKKGAGNHHCHWPGCDKNVPPAMWGCRQHWYMLPAVLRIKIWRTYRPGQEITKTPSKDYIAVAREVQKWIVENRSVRAREIEEQVERAGGDGLVTCPDCNIGVLEYDDGS